MTRSSTTCVTPTSSPGRAEPRPGRRTRSSTQRASPLANAAFQWDFGFGYTLVDHDLMQPLRLGAGLRAPQPQRPLGPSRATTGGLRGRRGTPRRFPRRMGRDDGNRARPARDGDPRLGDGDAGRPGRARLWPERAEPVVRGRPRRRPAPRQLARLPRVVADDDRVRRRRRPRSSPERCPARSPSRRRSRAWPRGPRPPVPATFTSSSPTGDVLDERDGAVHPTVTVTLPGGAFATAQVFYQDTTTGILTITASGAGVIAGTRGSR